MSIVVAKAGLQSTIQAQPRSGLRHLGVPASGPADPLSMALANRLVGNPLMAPAIEVTLSGASFDFEAAAVVAVAGAAAELRIGKRSASQHEALEFSAGDTLHIGAARSGARVYLAVAGGIGAAEVLGSASTYAPAGLGGLEGRALQDGDRLPLAGGVTSGSAQQTPTPFRPPLGHSWAIRVCDGAETDLLDEDQRRTLFDSNFTVGRRGDRMGLRLDGPALRVPTEGRMPSAPVFPGTVQCPENGRPFLLLVDAHTTGGYPRIAQVARCDRHILGQLRPGDHVRLVHRDPGTAARELREKHDLLREWLPEIETVV